MAHARELLQVYGYDVANNQWMYDPVVPTDTNDVPGSVHHHLHPRSRDCLDAQMHHSMAACLPTYLPAYLLLRVIDVPPPISRAAFVFAAKYAANTASPPLWRVEVLQRARCLRRVLCTQVARLF
jgi:hypothetical protein